MMNLWHGLENLLEIIQGLLSFWREQDATVLWSTLGLLLIVSCLVARGVDRLKQSHAKRKEQRKRFAAACVQAREFVSQITSARQSFIDNRQVEDWRVRYADAFRLLDEQNADVANDIQDACRIYANLRAQVNGWNAEFVRAESARCNELFGRLDAHQREACVTDEVATLVVAGAGSGKTSTVQKKVEYLVRVKNVNPSDILLLSFTNKAADEMTSRLHESMPDIVATASTFHKFGLDIVKRHRPGGYDICNPRFCSETVLHAISPEALTDDECRGLLRFFAFCINAEPSESNQFRTFGDYIDATRTGDLQTLRSVIGDKTHDKATYQGELVKSFEELEIANWLFLNGIRYEYEKKYDHPIPDDPTSRHRIYKPDFYLSDYGIWIEHFGIDALGEPPQFYSEAERVAYKAGIIWKRQLHAANKTRLVESYSWWHTEGKLTENLWAALKPLGVTRHSIDPRIVWEQMLESPKSKLVHEFARLVSSFISLAKSNRLTSDTLQKVMDKSDARGMARVRLNGFIEQVRPLFRKYEDRLKEENAIDFHDMINEAADWIVAAPNELHKYRHVIVDEFQDISMSRAKLLQAVVAATDAKLFCVGDDWQSIYRFAGSDISIFTHFADYFGFTRTIRLENTYRNSQELLSIAGGFIMKNAQQLKKCLKSRRHCERPVVCVPYGEGVEWADALHEALNEIATEAKGDARSVLLLGRHNCESMWPLAAADMSANEARTSFKWKPHPELQISFMTIHKAKGLEADYVILLNFKDDLLGFPNSIADDPILSLLLSAPEEQPYAEERRVFYVALTRTRTRIYILVPTNGASVFMEDLPLEAVQSVFARAQVWCPKCRKGHLVWRTPKSGSKEPFYGCSNYPRCDYTLPKQRIAITGETPRCTCGGFLVPVRNPKNGGVFMGCTEFARLQPYQHIRYRIENGSSNKT